MSKYKDAHLLLVKVINIFVVIFAHHRHHQVNESKCKINVQNHPHADDVYFHLEKGPTAVRACQGSLGGGVSNTCHAASAFLRLFLLFFPHRRHCHCHCHHFYCCYVFHQCIVLFVSLNNVISKARILCHHLLLLQDLLMIYFSLKIYIIISSGWVARESNKESISGTTVKHSRCTNASSSTLSQP